MEIFFKEKKYMIVIVAGLNVISVWLVCVFIAIVGIVSETAPGPLRRCVC